MSEDEHGEDTRAQEALARLRASDPAASTSPDAARLDRLTSQRRGDELAARRDPRPRRWAAIAAVAAGAIVVGGTGYTLGAAGPGEDSQDTTTAVGVAPSEQTSGAAGQTEAFVATPDIARALPYLAAQAHTTFTASGLSSAAGEAPAWAFDAGAAGAAMAGRAAEVFGVPGEPAQEHGSWRVGSSDGTGPMVTLANDGTASASFHDPALYELLDHGSSRPMPLPMPAPDAGTRDPDAQDTGVEDTGVEDTGAEDTSAQEANPEDTSAQEASPEDMSVPSSPGLPTPVEPAGPVPADEAAAFNEAMTALGLDTADVELESRPGVGESEVISVVAHQVLDGHRTGYSWNAEVVGDRLYSFYGPLAPVVELGNYDVVSPARAVERLTDPRFGGTQVSSGNVEIMDGPIGWGWGDPAGPPPAAGALIEWPVTDVVITAADLTLTQHAATNGSTLLLPAYELSDDQGQTWRVPAVADHELAF